MSLAIEHLSVKAATPEGMLPILADITFRLSDGATLGIVGESGSGKSILALAVVGLLPRGMAAEGRILLDGRDLLALSEADLCHVRGARIGMIFQEPATALNPAMRIGDQIAEGLLWHRRIDRAAAKAQALRLLERVRMPEARRRFAYYPHELSGGQRQRVGIAIALAPEPKLLIADEPTTALDVTVQSEILDLLAGLVTELGMSLILISHDLGVIAGMTERTLVLYAGTRFEEGPTESVLARSLNPYTRGLLAALPERGLEAASGGPADRRTRRLPSIPGNVPQMSRLPPGCRFVNRCSMAIPACRPVEPVWRELRPGHGARCIRAQELL
jgi:peptide/nickel transport system ATP-binding protein